MRTLISGLLVALLAITLAGCGEKPIEPKPLESPTASATPTQAAAPELPAAAAKKTKAGAEAFVRYYVALINHGIATLNTEALRQAFEPTCVKCERIAYGLDQVALRGGEITGNQLSVASIRIFGPRDQRWFVDTYVNNKGGTTVGAAGGSPSVNKPATDRLYAFVLKFQGGKWTAVDLDPGSAS